MTIKNCCLHSCTWNRLEHGLRTPNEGINKKNLKFWADVADKIWLLLQLYQKIWDWDLIFGRAVKAISSVVRAATHVKTEICTCKEDYNHYIAVVYISYLTIDSCNTHI